MVAVLMGAPKPCLGYPRRTAAIAAMRAEGKTTAMIAQMIGIAPSTVTALEAGSAERKKSRRGGVPGARTHRPGRMKTAVLETAIMDMWDEGRSKAAIVAALNVNPRTVESIIQYMREGAADVASGRGAITSASAALLAALRRHHPEMCGGLPL